MLNAFFLPCIDVVSHPVHKLMACIKSKEFDTDDKCSRRHLMAIGDLLYQEIFLFLVCTDKL